MDSELNSEGAKARSGDTLDVTTGQIADSPAGTHAGHTEAALVSCFASSRLRCSLESIAETWLGTPWCANSAVKGGRGGVSCHHLPRAILVEAGWLPATFPVIAGDPNSTRRDVSVIATWLDGRAEFVHLEAPAIAALQPGDVVGLRIRRVVDHLGLCLGGGRFIHVLAHKATLIDRITDPTWSSRLLAVWRPIHSPLRTLH